MNEYKHLFSDLLPTEPIKVPPFELKLKEDAQLKEFKSRKTGPHQKKWCRKQIEQLMELNILRYTESCMLSPSVFAVKNKAVIDPAQQEFSM